MSFWSSRTISRQRPHRTSRSSGSTWGAAGFKRNQDRKAFEGSVTMIADGERIRSTSGDLSEGGAFVMTSTPPVVGERVRMIIRLDERLSMQVDATVRWHNFDEDLEPIGCGVQFLDMDETRILALRDVLSGGAQEEVEQVAQSEERTRATG
jgi:uncharacterized protein (TIGR02266 family)